MLRRAPAAARNRDPILAVLQRVLPARGEVLEVASGTGEHVVHFAAALPHLSFQPSDPDPDAQASVEAWRAHEGLPNVRRVIDLDVQADAWPIPAADAVLCINMVHIAPFEATIGLLRGAAQLLPEAGPLVLYGPYRVDGRHTAASNEDFDSYLRERNPAWGVRDLRDVQREADRRGLALEETVSMPANNLCVIFRRR